MPLALFRAARGKIQLEGKFAVAGNDPEGVAENEPYSVICAWCNSQIREGSGKLISHGICLTCLGDKFHYAIEKCRTVKPPGC